MTPRERPEHAGTAEEEIARLMERLAHAEEALAAVAAGQVDSIVQPAGYVYLLHDVQQMLHASTEKLRESEAAAVRQSALLSAVLDNAPDFITQVDANGVIRFANRVAPPLSPGQVFNQHWENIALPEDRPAMRTALETVIGRGETASFERRGEDSAGRALWYSTHVAPLRDGDRITGAVIISRDVTTQKAAEAQLMIADRMASVGMLAAGVAHEINNPLAALLANLGAVAEVTRQMTAERGFPADLQGALDEAAEAAGRIKFIVRDLKLFSRVEGDKRESLEIAKVLDSTLRMAWNEVRHRARLTRNYGPAPRVDANEARLGQVFLNLIVNAAQAIPEGHYADNEIRVSTAAEDGGVVVRIADTGAGIPLEVQKRLFTPFFTTKAVGVGTGLGLSICQRIISGLGGTISFTSEPGKGTEFRIFLPATDKASATETPAAGVRRVSPRARLLLIDDDAMVGKAARRLLSLEHEVTFVKNAEEAQLLFDRGERFDVLLCDLMMPQVTGMELYQRLLRDDPDHASRMVFMTGGAFTQGAREFLDTVPNPRIDKPFDEAKLREIIERTAERSPSRRLAKDKT